MGNFISSITSIGVPLFNHLVTIPFIFHPHRWGGLPFTNPSGLYLTFITVIINVISLMIIGTVSGIMSTKQACRKSKIFMSIKRSIWVVLGYITGNIILHILPFLKVPLLPFMITIPYGGWLVHGILVALPILLFGSVGNTLLRDELCSNK